MIMKSLQWASAALVLSLAGAAPIQALAQAPQTSSNVAPSCPPPHAPPPESLRPAKSRPKPVVPECAASRTCRNSEVEHYNTALVGFNADIQTWNRNSRLYVDALNRWQQEVADYSRCEMDAMNAVTPGK